MTGTFTQRKKGAVSRVRFVDARIPEKVARVQAAAEKSLTAGRKAYETVIGPISDAIDKHTAAYGMAFSQGESTVTIPIEISQALWLHIGDWRPAGRQPLDDLTPVMKKALLYKAALKVDSPELTADQRGEKAAEKFLKELGLASVDRFVYLMSRPNKWKRDRRR